MGCSVTPVENLYLWLFLFSLFLGGSAGAWIEAFYRHILLKRVKRGGFYQKGMEQKGMRRRRIKRPRGSITLALFLAVALSAVLLSAVLLLDFSSQHWSRELLMFAAPVFLSGAILTVGRKVLLLPVMLIALFGFLQLRSEFSSSRAVHPDLVLEEIHINMSNQGGISFETAGDQRPLETDSRSLSFEAAYLKPDRMLFFLPSCGYIRLTELSGVPVNSDKPLWPGTLTGWIIDRLKLWQIEEMSLASATPLSFHDYYLKVDMKEGVPKLHLIPVDADS